MGRKTLTHVYLQSLLSLTTTTYCISTVCVVYVLLVGCLHTVTHNHYFDSFATELLFMKLQR